MHLCLFAPLASDLHPWALICSDACAKSIRAFPGLIALVGSSFATCVLQLLPVELRGTRGMSARVA